MAQFFAVHPDNPQERLIKQAVEIINQGGVVVYPTDSCYALGCKLGDKAAMERILSIRKIDQKHHLTLVCADLSELGSYAKIDNVQFRQLKAATPGPYTFILQATKDVPARTLHPKRKTIGLRIPECHCTSPAGGVGRTAFKLHPDAARRRRAADRPL